MSKSIFYIVFMAFFLFAGNAMMAQSDVARPTCGDCELMSPEEMQQMLENIEPHIGYSNIEMPEGFSIITNMTENGPENSLSSKGTDFWLLFMRNYTGSAGLFLDITSDVNTSGNVSITGIGFSQDFTVTANTITRIIVPSSAMIMNANVVQSLGIRVVAEDDVTVYGTNQIPFTTDSFLGLPVSILGTQYLAISYYSFGGVSSASEFAIVSPYNNNVVTITPSQNTNTGQLAGVPFNVTLNQGETYMLQGASVTYNDLTGSVIESSLPVALFSGAACTNVPAGVTYCDHIVQQLPPVSSWGNTFVTRNLEGRNLGDTWRFMASQNNTELNINGGLVATLGFGDFFETILDGSNYVEASKPILTVQYSNGNSYDGASFLGDPFMMFIPPFQQFLNGYTFATPADGFVTNYFTVTVENDGIPGMLLDGMPLDPLEFSGIAGTDFSTAAFPININSSYNVSNSDGYPFGLYVYGFNADDSYGYPGGLSLLSINPGNAPEIELANTLVELFCTSISQSVDIDISAIITFDEEALAPNATLFYRLIGGMGYTSMPMTEGVNDLWSASISAAVTEFPGIEFYISASDGFFTSTSPSIDPANNPYSLAIGNLPPDIIHVPVMQAPVAQPILISADVVDDTDFVQSVELFYRIAGGTPFYSVLAMNNTGGNTYEATILGNQMTGLGLEYYIKATDNFGVSCTYGLADVPLFINEGVAGNIPPIPVGFPGMAPTINIGDTYSLTVQFQSPEAGQTTDVVVNDGGLPGFTYLVTPGNTAEVEFELIGQNDNPGTHFIEFVATDNGDPAMSTTVIFQISVIDPLEGHVICIPEGWSGISTYNEPNNPDMVDIFAGLVADNKVVIVLGDNGFYWPSQNINTFTNGWDVKKGYKIKMSEPGCLGIPGEMPGDKSFNAKKGASFIPVLCDQPVPAGDIFSQFGDDMLFAFDIYAQLIYWPAGELYTLETLEPGVGYLVSMLNAGQATYGDCSRSSVENHIKAQPPVYKNAPWSFNNTGNLHLISISQSAIAELQPGDFIGVFNSEGVCTGFTQFNGESGNLLLTAYGNDQASGQDGLNEGESMSFKIFRANAEIPVSVVFDASMPDAGSYIELGQSKIVSIKAGATSVFESKLNEIRLHPNPSNGIVNVDMPLIDEAINIQVVNSAGQVVHSEVITGNNSRHQLDLSMVRQGVYFVKITGSNESVVKKIVIQ